MTEQSLEVGLQVDHVEYMQNNVLVT